MEFYRRLTVTQILEELRSSSYLTSDSASNVHMSVNHTANVVPQPVSTINVQMQISLSTDNPSESTFQYRPGFYNLPFGLPPIAPVSRQWPLQSHISFNNQYFYQMDQYYAYQTVYYWYLEMLAEARNFYDHPADNEEQCSQSDMASTGTGTCLRNVNQNPIVPPIQESNLYSEGETSFYYLERKQLKATKPLRDATENVLGELQRARPSSSQPADDEEQHSGFSSSNTSSTGTGMWPRNVNQNPIAAPIGKSICYFENENSFKNLERKQLKAAKPLKTAVESQLRHAPNVYDQPADNEKHYSVPSSSDTSSTGIGKWPRNVNQNPIAPPILKCNSHSENQNSFENLERKQLKNAKPLKNATKSQLDELQQARNFCGQLADNKKQDSRRCPFDTSSTGTGMWLRNVKQNPIAPSIQESNFYSDNETSFENLERKQLKNAKPLKNSTKSQLGELQQAQNFYCESADNKENYSRSSPSDTSSTKPGMWLRNVKQNPSVPPIRKGNFYFDNETSLENLERKQLKDAKPFGGLQRASNFYSQPADNEKHYSVPSSSDTPSTGIGKWPHNVNENLDRKQLKDAKPLRFTKSQLGGLQQAQNFYGQPTDNEEQYSGCSPCDTSSRGSGVWLRDVKEHSVALPIWKNNFYSDNESSFENLDGKQLKNGKPLKNVTESQLGGLQQARNFYVQPADNEQHYSVPSPSDTSSTETGKWPRSVNQNPIAHPIRENNSYFKNETSFEYWERKQLKAAKARKIEAVIRDQSKSNTHCSRNSAIKKIIEEITLASSKRRDAAESANGNDGDELHAGSRGTPHAGQNDLQHDSSYSQPATVRGSTLRQEISPRSIWHPAAPTRLDYHQQAQAGQFSYANVANNDNSSFNSCASSTSQVTFSSPTNTKDSSETTTPIETIWPEMLRDEFVESHLACLRALRFGNCDEPIAPEAVNDIQTGLLVDSPPIATDQRMDTNIFQFSDDWPSHQEYCPFCDFCKF